MNLPPPEVRLDAGRVVMAGEWTLAALLPRLKTLRPLLDKANGDGRQWDFSAVERLDSAAATLIWQTWKRQWPPALEASPELRHILERAAAIPDEPRILPARPVSALEATGRLALRIGRQIAGVIALFGRVLLDCASLIRRPAGIPWREFSANVYKAGAQALPVSALVGFLIGVTISYLSALQLKTFGAELFIVNILGISIVRELGPVLVAVLVAGRSGSAMTAQIGVMRVTEEIDALSVMGIPLSQRIVLPKVAALALAMPLLVLWTSASALIGGMIAAYLQLDLSFGFFIEALPRAVPIANLFIGLGKGFVFGTMIALIACHFGLRVRPNTESLSANTTLSVVASITIVILVDAVFAVMTRSVGMPAL